MEPTDAAVEPDEDMEPTDAAVEPDEDMEPTDAAVEPDEDMEPTDEPRHTDGDDEQEGGDSPRRHGRRRKQGRIDVTVAPRVCLSAVISLTTPRPRVFGLERQSGRRLRTAAHANLY